MFEINRRKYMNIEHIIFLGRSINVVTSCTELRLFPCLARLNHGKSFSSFSQFTKRYTFLSHTHTRPHIQCWELWKCFIYLFFYLSPPFFLVCFESLPQLAKRKDELALKILTDPILHLVALSSRFILYIFCEAETRIF